MYFDVSRHEHPSRRGVRRIARPALPGCLALLAPLLCAQNALAMPFNDPVQKRDTAHDASVEIWVPIVVVVLAVVGLIILGVRRGWRINLANFSAGAAVATGTAVPTGAGGARELTAEQLAGGTTAGTTAPTTQTGTAGRAARRTRRARRTPSQISTTSLPAYQKEPGDEELVVYRGPEDMEDAGVTVIMPPVIEDDVEGPFTSQASLPNHNGDEQDNSSAHLMAPATESVPRRSIDTGESSTESSSLLQTTPAQVPDPRGEAPAYFEHVPVENEGTTSMDSQRRPTIDLSDDAHASADAPADSTASRRRSGFRSLFNALTPNAARPPIPPIPASAPATHGRADSHASMVSMSSDASRTRTHRPSHSGGSNLTSSMFRTISRQRSSNTLNSAHLNSPSTISLHSISSPLAHTLVRTEITYPKSGPTPEQMKLISSRESFARFGMPYGKDAIAYAASTSRQELNPPPDFDAASPGPSGRHSAQSSSSTNELPRASEEANSSPVSSDSANGSGDVPPERPADNAAPEQEPTEVPVTASPESTEVDSATVHDDKASIAPTETTEKAVVRDDATEIIPSTTSTKEDLEVAPAPAESNSPSTGPSTSIATANRVNSPTSPKATAPPTSFRPYQGDINRSVSRASSVTSFNTAAESMGEESSDAEFETPQPSEPSTPRLNAQHLHENTDATITPTTLPPASQVAA